MQRTICRWIIGTALAAAGFPVCAQQPTAMLVLRVPIGGTGAEQEPAQFGFTLGYSRPQATLGPPPASVRPPSLEFNFNRDGFDGLRVGGYNTQRFLGAGKPQGRESAPSLRFEERVTAGEFSPGEWRATQPALPTVGIGLRPSPQGAEALAPALALPPEEPQP
ncbi:MAG: hypothetical protein ACREUW_00580 [Burkholderiales bacterium]